MLGLLGVYILLYSLFPAVILRGSSSLLGLPRCPFGSLRLFSQAVDNSGGVVLSRLKSPYIAGGRLLKRGQHPVYKNTFFLKGIAGVYIVLFLAKNE